MEDYIQRHLSVIHPGISLEDIAHYLQSTKDMNEEAWISVFFFSYL